MNILGTGADQTSGLTNRASLVRHWIGPVHCTVPNTDASLRSAGILSSLGVGSLPGLVSCGWQVGVVGSRVLRYKMWTCKPARA